MRLNPDSIPTSEQVRETLFDRYYFPYKKPILAFLTLLAIAIVATLAVREWKERQRDEQWARRAAAMSIQAERSAPEEERQRRLDERLTVLRRLLQDFPDSSVTPYALHDVLVTQIEAKRYDDALKTLEELTKRFGDFALSREGAVVGSSSRTLADQLEAALREEATWEKETTYVHPAPSADYAALIETTAGKFWIGFYPEHAPRHVENFVSLAKQGWFNGTQVYEALQTDVAGQPAPVSFEAGSAASKHESPTWTDDPKDHDRDEPEALIEPEDSRYTIRHRKNIVSSVVMPSGESARRFFVVAAVKGLESKHNKENTPFAAVLDKEDSLAAVERLALAPTYFTNPETKDHPLAGRMRNHPYPYVWIRRVTIWRDEKKEDGHTWDTSRAATNEPEPWETGLPKPKVPSDYADK